MAASDYYLCDVCGKKAFYDANLDYNSDGSLGYVGEMAVICTECAKTHDIKIVAQHEAEPVAEVAQEAFGPGQVVWLAPASAIPDGTLLYRAAPPQQVNTTKGDPQ